MKNISELLSIYPSFNFQPRTRSVFLAAWCRHKSNQLNRLQHRTASHESDFPFLRCSPFLDRSQAFLGYLLQLVSLYISFHPHHCKSRLSKNYFISVLFTILYFIFQFRSPVARWTSTGPATTGPESIFSTWKHLLTLIAIIASPNPENITLQW